MAVASHDFLFDVIGFWNAAHCIYVTVNVVNIVSTAVVVHGQGDITDDTTSEIDTTEAAEEAPGTTQGDGTTVAETVEEVRIIVNARSQHICTTGITYVLFIDINHQ